MRIPLALLLPIACSPLIFAGVTNAQVDDRPDRASATYQPGVGQHSTFRGNRGDAPQHPAEEPSQVATDTPAAAAPAAPGAGLIIDATFDSSITSAPNAGAIESAVNEAISQLQSLFSDPIHVSILFRYSKNYPNGTPLQQDFVATSYYVIYHVPWDTYIDALKADLTTGNDSTADATLPYPLSTNLVSTSADGRAIGLDTPPAMYANGSVSAGGPYDGIVTLNATAPIQFTRPAGSNTFDAVRFIQHELDEVLGLGSFIGGGGTDLRPQDLFSWSGAGARNRSSSGNRYFSIDGGQTSIVGFNQQAPYDYGDWYSAACPQASPFVQNAVGCPGQSSDVTAGSPEGINLDVIGYDLASAVQQLHFTIAPSLPGAVFTVDGVSYTSAQTFTWGLGSHHTIATTYTQSGGGVQYTFAGWSDYGQMSHAVDTRTEQTITAWFTKQYYLNMTSDAAGTVWPATGWYEAGQSYAMEATPRSGHGFVGWTGSGNGSYSGTDNPALITFNGPLTETASFGSAPPPTPTPTPTPTPGGSPAQLQNISTRLDVGQNDNVLIGGFIITGSEPKKVMLRATGPSLGLTGALPNPTLELHLPNGIIVPNDDWKIDLQTGGSQEAAIRATGIPPSNDLEAALVQTLPPGSYTAIVKGKNGGTGIATIEAYDLAPAAAAKLANISSRGLATTGDNVLIGGFIIGPADGAATKVIIRACGPSLGVSSALPDPTLELHNGNGVMIASNDNWQNDASAAQLSANQIAPTDPRESAFERVLSPGAYTAIVAGKDGQTGLALVEVYGAQ